MKKQFVKPQLRELPMTGESLLTGSTPQIGGQGTSTGEQNAKAMTGSAMGSVSFDL